MFVGHPIHKRYLHYRSRLKYTTPLEKNKIVCYIRNTKLQTISNR
jgi:hypothetical protein